MGVNMNVNKYNKETKCHEMVKSEFCTQLGFENVQVNTGFRIALKEFINFQEGYILITTKDMDKAIEQVLKVNTIVYPDGCYYGGEYKGLSIEEKSMFIQMATICKVKGWNIAGA